MKRMKNLMILGGVLVALIAGIVISKMAVRHVDSIQNADEEIVALDADKVASFTIKGSDRDISFEKTEDGWVSTDDSTFPVDQDALADFLAEFKSVHASFVIDDVEDYDQYGLKNPEYTITFRYEGAAESVNEAATEASTEAATEAVTEAATEAETAAASVASADGTITIYLGGFSTMDSKRYVAVGDGKAYLIDTDLAEILPESRDDLMQHDELPAFDTYESVKVAGDTSLEIAYEPDEEYTYTDSFDYYLISGEDHKALSTTLVKSYIDNVAGLSLTDYATYNASTADLSKYGLDNPALTVTMTGSYEEGKENDEDGNAKATEYTVSIGLVNGNDDNCYVRVGESEIIYKVTKDVYDAMADGSFDSLRSEYVERVNWDNVTSVDFTLDGENYTVTKSGDDWKMEETTVSMDDVKSSLDALTIKEFNSSTPEKGEEISLTIHQDNEKYPEVTIKAYKVDGDNCLVTFNGETLGLTARADLIDFKEAVTSMVLGSSESES